MKRGIVALIAAIALMSAAGVGFATFTSSVYVNATASAGSVNLQFTSPTSAIPATDPLSNDPVTCSAVLSPANVGPSPFAYSSTKITFTTTSYFASGDTCTFNAYQEDSLAITNFGSLAATIAETATCSVNGGAPTTAVAGPGYTGIFSASWVCGYFLFGDTVTDGGYGPIAAGASDGYAAALVLPAGTGNAAEGQSVTFVVTITGSIGS